MLDHKCSSILIARTFSVYIHCKISRLLILFLVALTQDENLEVYFLYKQKIPALCILKNLAASFHFGLAALLVQLDLAS